MHTSDRPFGNHKETTQCLSIYAEFVGGPVDYGLLFTQLFDVRTVAGGKWK